METLKDYYKSKHWKKFRANLTDDINCECEICGRKRWALYKRNTKKNSVGSKRRLLIISVHHKTYDTLGHEKREDVMVLCRFCHELGHLLQRSSVMCDGVYLKMYEDYKLKTGWEYSKKPK